VIFEGGGAACLHGRQSAGRRLQHGTWKISMAKYGTNHGKIMAKDGKIWDTSSAVLEVDRSLTNIRCLPGFNKMPFQFSGCPMISVATL